MGYSKAWVQMVMRCVESVSYYVVLNGEIGDMFASTRGLRQGDPLSPYLFLICSERLSTLLRKASSTGSLKGVRINRHAHHLLPIYYLRMII